MKKIIVIIITLMFILAGCSSAKKDTPNKNASSNTGGQSQLNSHASSQNAESTNDNIDTSKSLFKNGYYDYRGTINNNLPIHMSIYPLKADIVGSYFYDSKKTELKLKGKAGEKDIVLYEYDDAGKNTGIFKGTMSSVDNIEGTWFSADKKKSYPFKLSLISNVSGFEYGKRYAAVVHSKSDQDVENFAAKIQSYVKSDNKAQLASLVTYPITVKINGKPEKILNKDDFIKNYSLIFYPAYKKTISNAYTKYLFVNWQGIMFGENLYNIWINEINSKLMITGINN